MAVRCILFDLFGTLVQYDAGRISQGFHQTHELVQSLGSDVSYDDFVLLADQILQNLEGVASAQQREFSMFAVATELFRQLELDIDDTATSAFADAYTGDWSAGVAPIHGTSAFLSRCRKQFVTGIITNTHYEPMVHRLLDQHGLTNVALVTCSVTHGRPKPHPDIFLDTASALGVDPRECVYVGDNYQADFLGASGVGMTCYLAGKHARVPREFQIPTAIDLPLHLLK